MGQKNKESQENWSVRVGQEELGRIFHLRDSLDQSETLIQHAALYQEIGWSLVAVETETGEDSALDFSQSPETWGERVMTLALAGVQLDLAVKTGAASRLLVIETLRDEVSLDPSGKWRSPCRAHDNNGRELNFFTMPPGSRVPLSGEAPEMGLRVYGEGGLVMTPGPRLGDNGAVWTWLTPPWETPPGPPDPSVWQFLEECQLLAAEQENETPTAEILSWEEVYALIAPHQEIIQTLLTPAVSVTAYYQDLVNAAVQAGLVDPAVLLAIMWHAPQGDARISPERLAYLRELAASASKGSLEPGPVTSTAPPGALAAEPGPAADSHGYKGDQAQLPLAPDQPPMNELVGFMENRVILDRSRYDAMVFELGELSARSSALERRLEEWERRFGRPQPPPSGPSPEFYSTLPAISSEFPGNSPGTMSVLGPETISLAGLKTVVQEFLRKNADLAGDPKSVQMLQFCLKNYIDLNPELNGLPLREKLEMAGKMAREFLALVDQDIA